MLSLKRKYDEYAQLGAAQISFDTSLHVLDLLVERQPKVIYDLGSGWSTYLFAQYAPEGSRIVSFEESAEWLAVTAAFCKGMPVEFKTWGELDTNYNDLGELVLHDIGDRDFRAEKMHTVAHLVAPGGVLLIDDVHKAEIETAAKTMGAIFNYELINADDRCWTFQRSSQGMSYDERRVLKMIDQTGRFGDGDIDAVYQLMRTGLIQDEIYGIRDGLKLTRLGKKALG